MVRDLPAAGVGKAIFSYQGTVGAPAELAKGCGVSTDWLL